MIKGIMLDYGGTIDTHGIHWAQIIWSMYNRNTVEIDRDLFYQAYVHGERTLATHRLVLEHHTFFDVLFIKVKEQFAYLNSKGKEPEKWKILQIVEDCYKLVLETIAETRPIIEELSTHYPIVLVSNFYGNLNKVLAEFKLTGYFQDVIESAKVGVRKPDPRIFELGLERLGLRADESLVIGDSYTKDMVPALTLGCQGLWLNVAPWEEEAIDVSPKIEVIGNLAHVSPFIHQNNR